jgi:L-cysteine:1D-myo-inositol 2-amino-2-deoxy-alpha-D-glucopyranoside ligase
MNSWPKFYLPPLEGYQFPDLKIIDSSKGLTGLNSGSTFSMYVCGITPYDATHLGHAATYLAFDLINRYQVQSSKSVSFVENITDIDDPLLERAKRDGKEWQQLADSQIDLFASDMSALRILPPDHFIKVTDSFDLIEKFMMRLNESGYLYILDGDYYFSVTDFLTDLPMSIEQASEIFAERGGDPQRAGKKHPLDPVIWLSNREGEPGWSSSFGFGRPGWHVECTAIACHFIENESDPIIDLQGGGSDLIFPHHYMCAQIVRAAYGRNFAGNYVHTGMIGLDGEKMSKSKGNLVFVSELINKGIDPMVIRWALLSGHYQSDRQWSSELLNFASLNVEKVRTALSRTEVAASNDLIQSIILDLANNLDTPSSLDRLLSWADKSEKEGNVNQSGEVSRAIDALLGLTL